MKNNTSDKIKKELLDYNFLDEEWSDDEPQSLISIEELQNIPETTPVEEQPRQPRQMNVIENKNKKREMTAKEKLREIKRKNKYRRAKKPKLKKHSMNVLTHAKNMMIYLNKPDVINMRKELSESEFRAHVAEKFVKLAKDYDTIFNKTLEGQMNLDMLAFLCTEHERLRRGSDQYNTDARVGQRVFNEYAKKID